MISRLYFRIYAVSCMAEPSAEFGYDTWCFVSLALHLKTWVFVRVQRQISILCINCFKSVVDRSPILGTSAAPGGPVAFTDEMRSCS